MKMVNSRCTFNLFLTLLLSVNSIFMLLYLYKMTNNDDSDSRYQNSNKLTLDLEIMDIYRLDISCDYITQALAEKISSKYKNKHKKCSLSSLDPNINELVSKSVNQTSTHYAPLFNVSATLSFDPYDMNSEVNQKKQYPQFQSLQLGGNWLPSLNQNRECNHNDLDSIVFIVPFSKSRMENLKLFLINIHSYLQSVKYKFNYRIIVAEQEIKQNDLFNKGRLINRAVKYASDSFKHIDCLVIHDVDLVPSNNQEFILKDKGDYRCRQMPWHLSNEVYSLSRKESRVYNKFLTGGILSLRPAHFINSNGFSNMYFGWGAEDDDFTLRMFSSKLCIMRPSDDSSLLAPFTMLEHSASKVNNKRHKQLLNSIKSKEFDGSSNIERLTEIKSVKYYLTFTHLLIGVNANFDA